MQKIEPYGLPLSVFRSLLDIAQKSDVLIFGELHGTQEVPRVMLSLLDDLATVGYRGLALEVRVMSVMQSSAGPKDRIQYCQHSLPGPSPMGGEIARR